jgi:phosphoribosylformylglycinamidine synthase
MDPVEWSLKKGIKDMEIEGIKYVKTGEKYLLYGKLTQQEVEFIATKLLYNPTIQHIVKGVRKHKKMKQFTPSTNYVEIIEKSTSELLELNERYSFGFNLAELKSIQSYYQKQKRNPTDIELETIAQTWSEHCIHKTFKSRIKFNQKIIPPLLEIIKTTTNRIGKKFCVSVFKDNAGIIKFEQNYNLCFKVETHNHPSAIEPYGGAGTGIGGVIRDILGAGLGGTPILNTDVFCFAPPNYSYEKLERGILHPLRIMKGVVSGVRDYGNKMGIPTVNGGVVFHPKYLGNPVVYCGTVGLIPRNRSQKKVYPQDVVILIGGKTGRDGIHGVTFASTSLKEETGSTSIQAVQIGNPIVEKKVLDVLIRMRDKGLYNSITDCGGGGLSSAIGELSAPYGVEVELAKVPLKYKGLHPWEIWISEAQERMVIFAKKEKVKEIMKECKKENVEATVIGKIRNDGKIILKYNKKIVGEIDCNFLHKSIPLKTKKAKWKVSKRVTKIKPEPKILTPYLLKLLSHLSICSRGWIIRQYDHEVQGSSVVKPIVGKGAPTDGAVVRPLLSSKKGVVVGCGINPRYGEINPFWMGAGCVDEAIRNVVALGGEVEHIALLDNFSWGNPDNPKRLGELVLTTKGMCYVAKKYDTPFISGKDSLNNEYKVKNKKISIPPTLLISAITIIKDVEKTVTPYFKKVGSSIYIVGKTFEELGGSVYLEIRKMYSTKVPKVRPNKEVFTKLNIAIKKGIVLAIHDCSEGGLGVTCSEMCIGGDIGVELNLKEVPLGEEILRDDFILFSESHTRFVVEVKNEKQFTKIMENVVVKKIGKTIKEKRFKVKGKNGKIVINIGLKELRDAWESTLNKYSTFPKKPVIQGNYKGKTISSFDIKYRPKVLILRTAGTNCDHETKFACEKVGMVGKLVHINQLIEEKKRLLKYDVLIIPGGFTYGDDLGAGNLLANEIRYKLKKEIEEFIRRKKLVLGICNGFQVLVKLGILPFGVVTEQKITLAPNTSGMFQCEWVTLKVNPTNCIFTQEIEELELPIAHREGRVIGEEKILKELMNKKQIPLQYKGYNPNGSFLSIAGICDPTGRVFGLMPHPERFISFLQHPLWGNNKKKLFPAGLKIFQNIMSYFN